MDNKTFLNNILNNITSDDTYRENIRWGKPRSGHQEGTIKAHIDEIEANIDQIAPYMLDEDVIRLKIITHVHDTFKGQANPSAAIIDLDSHASLARQFLSKFYNDDSLLNIVQFHDEPFAIFRKYPKINEIRFNKLINLLGRDIDLFVLFNMVDNITASKDDKWFLTFYKKVESKLLGTTKSVVKSFLRLNSLNK